MISIFAQIAVDLIDIYRVTSW